MFDIKEQLKTVTDKPGVYLMKDKQGVIIYVGKAKNLKKRLSSYFRGFDSHEPKTQTLVVNIAEFEYIIAASEVEALILEANLIKKYKPRFNIRLKDDKGYPYIKITLQEAFPRVMKARKVLKDKARYFGPYTSMLDVNNTLEVLNNVFPVRTCNRDLTKTNQRPCLNYHIKKCLGPCNGMVKQEEYMELINQIILFLTGKEDEIINRLEVRMRKYAEELKFEKAAEMRNQINSLRALTIKQNVVTTKQVDQDIISLAKKDEYTCVMIFFVRNGKLIGREHFMLEDQHLNDDSEILLGFIKQFYSGTAFIPKEIVLDVDIDDKDNVEEWLGSILGNRVYIKVAQKGEKKKLVNMVKENAKEYVEKFLEKSIREKILNDRNMIDLKNILKLESVPQRIEAYDISNLMGVHSVGSMVVYENGQKKKSDYRRFKVKTVEGPNDYASMQEVLFRRFRRGLDDSEDHVSKGFSKLPDLILIDGGKGQVSSVIDVAKALDIKISIAGMYKDDRHRTKGLYFDGVSYDLDKGSNLYKFIYGIQEEVHRFAISYHKSLRDKAMTQSVLDEIKGVGLERKKALIKHFKTIDKIKVASVEELAEVKGVTKKVAEEISKYFLKIGD